MHLAAQYQRQYAWRDWQTAYGLLPGLSGKTVLDLGCAVGDQSQALAALGATVIGVDMNAELLAEAHRKNIPRASFRQGDVRELSLPVPADGIWSSFTAAYFPDLRPVLQGWSACLKPGGWLALTEVDDMFGHDPLPDRSSQVLSAFAEETRSANRYDFSMGGKLAAMMEAAGLRVDQQVHLSDQELSFDGPARTDVLEAWAQRLDRMKLLQASAGAGFPQLRADFLACLASPAHRSRAKVCFCLGFKSLDQVRSAGRAPAGFA